MITVSPDFNRHRPPYSVVSDLERRGNSLLTGPGCFFCQIDLSTCHFAENSFVQMLNLDTSIHVFFVEVYEYTIEHVSKEITAKEKLREQKVVNDIYLRHQEHKTKAIGKFFCEIIRNSRASHHV